MLGQGSFGKVEELLVMQVYLAKHPEHDICVMKQMSTFGKSMEEIDVMMNESLILRSLKHPNITQFIDVFVDAKGKMNIIMEYASGGDLAGYIKKQEKK
jgi:NIMA (never in mitosis gene a)-related kinase